MINIRYAQIRECDVSNGDGVGVALFVQGCNFHCFNCFNKDTWDFNGGKEWTPEIEDKFIELANKPYIKRISILGGEPLADENLDGVLNLVNRFRLLFPEKTIWLYTGYVINIFEQYNCDHAIIEFIPKDNNYELDWKREEIIRKCNVVVDGRYIDSERNVAKKWAGSDNQRVINIFKSLEQGEVVLYCDERRKRSMNKIKIGDTVYLLTCSNIIFPAKCIAINDTYYTVLYISNLGAVDEITDEDFGDTVFLTMEEAEEKKESRMRK